MWPSPPPVTQVFLCVHSTLAPLPPQPRQPPFCLLSPVSAFCLSTSYKWSPPAFVLWQVASVTRHHTSEVLPRSGRCLAIGSCFSKLWDMDSHTSQCTYSSDSNPRTSQNPLFPTPHPPHQPALLTMTESHACFHLLCCHHSQSTPSFTQHMGRSMHQTPNSCSLPHSHSPHSSRGQ